MSGSVPPTPAGQPPANVPPAAGTPQQLNQIVMEYLSKKGYNRTEATLRMESAHTDNDGRPILLRPEDSPDTMYERAYFHLRRWIDNSLDIYKLELRRLLFPIWVHFYLNMIATGYQNPGRAFYSNHKQDHETMHNQDVMELSAIMSPQHVEENGLAKLYRQNKYRITLSQTTKSLLLHFLEETIDQSGKIVLDVINRYIDLKSVPGKAGMIFNREDDGMLQDEGIQGHLSGTTGIPGDNLAPVRLGRLPMDKTVMAEVEDELREEDARMSGITGADRLGVSAGGTLIEEFQKIKREETEDSPMRDAVPLPPYTVFDIQREVSLVKDSRDMIKLKGAPAPALPSVCMYTFHNTNDGLNCLDFSEDALLVAGGFAESYVRIWSLKGEPLESIIPAENTPTPPKSRRLIGHSGPVFGLSFSPDRKYLLSASEDKSTRLWSLDTYTGLVVYKGHDAPIWDVQFAPYGHYFATASHDHTTRLWSCDHIYPLRIFAGHMSDVDTVQFHPNSAYLFTGSSDKSARMWDVQSGNAVRVFTGHTAPVMALAVSPNGKYLATAGEDSLIALWDIAGGKRMKVMKGHGKTSIYSLSFSQESNVLVSAGADNTVRCWDVMLGTSAPQADQPEPLNGAGSAADGTTKVDGVPVPTGKRRGKDVVASPDQLAVWYTKKAPVYKVTFTKKNMVLAGSAFLP